MPMLEFDEVLEGPFAKERGMVLELDHPLEGTVRQLASPFTWLTRRRLFAALRPCWANTASKCCKALAIARTKSAHSKRPALSARRIFGRSRNRYRSLNFVSANLCGAGEVLRVRLVRYVRGHRSVCPRTGFVATCRGSRRAVRIGHRVIGWLRSSGFNRFIRYSPLLCPPPRRGGGEEVGV